MAIVTVNTNIKIGYDLRAIPTATAFTVTGTGGGLALPFEAQFTGNITRIVMTAVLSSNVTNLDVGLMGSNAAGDLPSDTYLATPNTFSGSANATNTNYIINLTNSVAVTKGNTYWLTFRPNASFTGSLNINQAFFGATSYNGTWRSATRTTSVWARSGTTGSNVIYGSSTNWYSLDIVSVTDDPSPITAAANQEYGVAFTLDANHPAVKVRSISFANSLNATNQPGMSFLVNVRDSSGTLLYSFANIDTDRIGTGTGQGNALFYNQSGSDIWLEPNTKYYLMMAYSGTFTTAPTISSFTFDTSMRLANGAYTANYANRSSGGVISETTTKFMPFHIEVDAIRFDNTGAGGGGFANASGMFSGGFSG